MLTLVIVMSGMLKKTPHIWIGNWQTSLSSSYSQKLSNTTKIMLLQKALYIAEGSTSLAYEGVSNIFGTMFATTIQINVNFNYL